MDPTQKADNTEALEKANEVFQKLLTTQQSAMLATVNPDGSPLVSYAPFVTDTDKNIYVFTSALSYHTANLLRTGQVSVMLIADETATAQIFARSRLTFACTMEALPRDTDTWQTAAGLYEKRFANMFKLLRGLSDFSMFKLTPHSGTLVMGFGAAYSLHGDNLSELTLRVG